MDSLNLMDGTLRQYLRQYVPYDSTLRQRERSQKYLGSSLSSDHQRGWSVLERGNALFFHPASHAIEDLLALQLVVQIMAATIPRSKSGHPVRSFGKRSSRVWTGQAVVGTVHQ